MRPLSVAGVILAAGFSRRLGRPKQNVELGGVTLLERAVQTVLEAHLVPLISVVRDPEWMSRLRHHPVQVVVNDQAAEGMASSLRAGIGAVIDAEVRGAVVLTCDQPLLRASHLRALAVQPDRITGSAYGGRIGVPAYFPTAVFPELMACRGDAGARDLLHNAASVQDEDLALDIDTDADVQRAEEILRSLAFSEKQ